MRRICDRFWSFLKGRSPLLGWKHPSAHIWKGKSLKKKKISFDGFLPHRDVLGFVLGFCQNLTALVCISLIFIFI